MAGADVSCQPTVVEAVLPRPGAASRPVTNRPQTGAQVMVTLALRLIPSYLILLISILTAFFTLTVDIKE